LIFAVALTSCVAQAQDKKKTTAPVKPAAKPSAAVSKPSAPVGKPLAIPKDATENPDGTYSYTDKDGKKWLFSKTPFGISRTEDMTGKAPIFATATPGQYINATDNGDTVKFERQSPFGNTKWEKNKSELNDEERAALARQAAKAEQKPE